MSFTQNPWQWALHLFFPWVTLASLYAGIYARVLRGELINNMNEDYIRTARAKGLSERRILYRHALRCSMITIVSLFGLDVGVLVGGAALLDRGRLRPPGRGMAHVPGTDRTSTCRSSWAASCTARSSSCSRARSVDVLYAYIDPRIRVVA